MFPNDIAGAIPIDTTSGINTMIIIYFGNFDFSNVPNKLSCHCYLVLIFTPNKSQKIISNPLRGIDYKGRCPIFESDKA
jgi:hypothetical protein